MVCMWLTQMPVAALPLLLSKYTGFTCTPASRHESLQMTVMASPMSMHLITVQLNVSEITLAGDM